MIEVQSTKPKENLQHNSKDSSKEYLFNHKKHSLIKTPTKGEKKPTNKGCPTNN